MQNKWLCLLHYTSKNIQYLLLNHRLNSYKNCCSTVNNNSINSNCLKITETTPLNCLWNDICTAAHLLTMFSIAQPAVVHAEITENITHKQYSHKYLRFTFTTTQHHNTAYTSNCTDWKIRRSLKNMPLHKKAQH